MWAILLYISLLSGQLGRIQITPTIAFYIHDVVIVFYIASRIPFLWRQRKNIYLLSLIKPIAVVSVVCAISLFANGYRFSTPDFVVGVSYFLRFFMYAILYVIVRMDRRPAYYWIKWLFTLGVGFAVLGILQLLVYPDLRNLSYDGWDPHYFRLFSTLLDPNFTGSILLLSFMSGVYVVQKQKQSIWVIGGLAIIFAALLLTYSRSSHVAAIGAFIAYIGITKKWKLLLVLLIFCLALLLLPAIGGESTMLFRPVTAFARVSNWQEGMQFFLQSPVIGFGFNMVKALVHNAPTLEAGVLARSTGGYDNSVIFILVTTGIVGLCSFIFLWMKMIMMGICVFNNPKSTRLGSVYIISLTAVFIHSMFLNTLFYPQLMILLWILTGAVEKEV
ncbi:MAG: O-antigen ligase family protein [Candidatus Gottesmanbacteria bacterium]